MIRLPNNSSPLHVALIVVSLIAAGAAICPALAEAPPDVQRLAPGVVHSDVVAATRPSALPADESADAMLDRATVRYNNLARDAARLDAEWQARTAALLSRVQPTSVAPTTRPAAPPPMVPATTPPQAPHTGMVPMRAAELRDLVTGLRRSASSWEDLIPSPAPGGGSDEMIWLDPSSARQARAFLATLRRPDVEPRAYGSDR